MCSRWVKIEAAVSSSSSWYLGAFVGPVVGWVEGISSVWIASSLDHSSLAHSETARWGAHACSSHTGPKTIRWGRGGGGGGWATCTMMKRSRVCVRWTCGDITEQRLGRCSVPPQNRLLWPFLELTFAVVYAVLNLPTIGHINDILAFFLEGKWNFSCFVLFFFGTNGFWDRFHFQNECWDA